MDDGSVPSGQPPGPDGVSFIGTTREFASDRLGFITRMAEEYSDIVRMPVAGGDDFYALFHPDHTAFDPDRWTGSFRRDLHPFAYFPFSGGPRRCLGDRFAMQEASLVVATLLRDVHSEALRGEDLEPAPAITLRGRRARFRPVW